MHEFVEELEVVGVIETSSFASTLAWAKSPKLVITRVKTTAVIQFVVRPAFLNLPVVIFLTLSLVDA